jgi:hypothetical protein
MIFSKATKKEHNGRLGLAKDRIVTILRIVLLYDII